MEKRPNIRDIPARCEYSRAIEPYRILEAGASLGLPERPEMRDTLLFSIKKDARSAKIQLQSNPHLRTHKISPGVCFATLYSPLLRRNTHSFSPCFTNVPHVFAGYVGPVSLRNFNNNKAEVLRYSLWCVT